MQILIATFKVGTFYASFCRESERNLQDLDDINHRRKNLSTIEEGRLNNFDKTQDFQRSFFVQLNLTFF